MGKKWSLCKWERYPIRRDGIRNNWRNCRQRVGRRERAPIVLRGTTGRLRSLPVSIFLSWLRRQTMIAFFSLSPYQPTLIRLMNKLRPGSIGRIDPREDGKLRMSNVTKFLASCSANGLSPEDIFHRDDLVEATSDSLARVSKTIIALVKWAETPVQTRSRISRGSGILKPINTSIAVKVPPPLGSPYRPGSSFSSTSSSRAAMSSPNLSVPTHSHSPSKSPPSPLTTRNNTRQQWTSSPSPPPSAGGVGLPTLRSASIDFVSSSSSDTGTLAMADGAETDGHETPTGTSDRDEVPPI